MPAASGQSANNIQVEAQALIADGANTAAEAGAGGVGVSGGGAGDIQRPPGVAAAMAIGEFWPSISENDIQRVVDEHRAAEQRLSDYGDTLKRKRSESPNLLQGQAGDARVERLTEMMNHAYAVADHLGSKAVTGESYKSTVVGLKTDLTRIGDAAQKAWEAAQTAKTPFSVAPYKTEAATAQSVICFLWFIGVVRDGLGRFEDKFFASVFLGSGLLFLAMIFVSSAVGVALVASRGADYGADVHVFGQALLIALSKTYALRMAAVFMMSLATIWLKTGLVSRGLVIFTYVVALTLLVASDVTVWLTLAFPVWVLIVSVLALSKAGLIDLHRDGD